MEYTLRGKRRKAPSDHELRQLIDALERDDERAVERVAGSLGVMTLRGVTLILARRLLQLESLYWSLTWPR